MSFCFIFFPWSGADYLDVNGGKFDDMVHVPNDVWNVEKHYHHSISNIRQTDEPPATACLAIKVIYNKRWVESAGGGDVATAHQRVLDVIAETKNIYNRKYAQANQLGTAIRFNIVGGTILHLSAFNFNCPNHILKHFVILYVLGNTSVTPQFLILLILLQRIYRPITMPHYVIVYKYHYL